MHGAFPPGKGNAASGSRIIVLVAQENFQQLIYCVCSAYLADAEAWTDFNAQSAIIAALTTNPERCRKVDGILRANTSALSTENAIFFMESYARVSSPALGIVAKDASELTSFEEY